MMPSERPVSISSHANEANLDEMRLANYRVRVKDQHETELRDIKTKHEAEVLRQLERQADLSEQLKRDYDVRISAQALELEDRLQTQRQEGEAKIAAEKANADKELEQIRSQSQTRIDQYRKNSEARIETVRKQEQDATAALHVRARKSENKLKKTEET